MRALAALGFVIASVLALVTLRAIAEAPTVDVAVPASTMHTADGIVRATLHEGLPPFLRHWDGQPPSAILVDASSGRVLAAAAFSDTTFDQNRNAVRFTDGEVRVKVDASRVAASAPLVVRVEAVRPRTAFHVWALVAIAMAAVAFVLSVTRRRQSRIRLAGAGIFVALALATFASAYPGVPVRVAEDLDEATLNSFAAVRDEPRAFALDKFLSDSSNYSWYTPAYINAIRVVRSLGFHYQTSAAFFGAVAALVYLFGLRRLFTIILGRDDYALVATLAFGLIFDQSMPPPGEFWSMIWLLPRTMFTACVPWIVLLALWALPTPRRWWMPCLAASVLVFIHPLSTVALVGAVGTALLLASDEPFSARMAGVAIAGVAVAIVMSPYVITYLSHYGEGRNLDPVAAARSLELIRGAFAAVAPGVVARQTLWYRLVTARLVLDAVVVVLLIRARFDTCMRFYLGIAAGLAIVTFGIPLLDAAVASLLGTRQLVNELTRNVRYLDLLVVCGIAIGVREWRGRRTTAAALAAAAALSAVFAFGPGWITTARMLAGRSRLSWRMIQGRPDVETAAAQEAIRAVVALHAPSERVAGPQGLREFGIPLTWISRDLSTLAYTASPALVESADVLARATPLWARPLTADSLQQLSSILEAQLFFVRVRQLDPRLLSSPRLLFRNEVYAVMSP